MIFLSLGAGVQSSVMLMRAIHGDIERPDHVIFADTGFEPKPVYKHLEWCQKQCDKAGILFHITQAKMNMREEFHAFESGEKTRFNSRPPFFAISNGIPAQTKRQCTDHAKIRPLKRLQLSLMGHKTSRTCKDGEAVIMVGISTDEARRAAPSQERWYDRSYPLIDPLKMSRIDCQSWWEQHYPHVNLPYSSCTICPFKTEKMWKQMKQESPEDWKEATDYDDRMRVAYREQTNQEFYLYKGYKPLADADLNETQGLLDLEDEMYCAGGCGL